MREGNKMKDNINTTAIEMRGISKMFETEEVETHALNDIDLVINKGDYVSISGPSGCGKSTLLSLLGLLDTPTSGEYSIDSINTNKIDHDRAAEIRNNKIGYIFQSFNLIDELSVLDNVGLPLRYASQKIPENEIAEKAKACVELVGLGHRLNHKPNQLSGGQQQRIAIARALVTDPAILLVDEPTGNLDSASGEQVMELLSKLNDKGTTICIVTHDSRYADMAKTRLRMLDGKITNNNSELKLKVSA